jgi:assimilatory nitrate reductase catalytic subunit
MGFASGFDFESSRDIFVEHARLSGVDNDGARAFDISGLANLTRAEYDALDPVQWPVRAGAPTGTSRLIENGRFFHADGKARFIATTPRGPVNAPSEEFPLTLNTGRVRDQWHTMTRTGRAPRLTDHLPEPFVDMHAQDALLAGIRDGELARVTSQWGSMAARLRTSGEITRGTVFVPIHWSSPNSSDARVGALVNAVVDPISGEPEFKHTPVSVEPLRVDWYGVLFAREPIVEPDTTWWTQMRGNDFVRYELAGRRFAHASPSARGAIDAKWARRLLGATHADADYIDYEDAAGGVYRGAWFAQDRLAAVVCIASRPQLPSRTWLASLFAKPRVDDNDRRGLLAGRPMEAAADAGALVCSCFRVGRNTICNAIERHGFTTPAQVGAHLNAGTNCGSCVPEIRALLARRSVLT